MDNHLTDLNDAVIIQVGQTTLLKKTSAQSQTSFEGQFLFQMRLFNDLNEYLDLAVALKELLHVKVFTCTANLLNILNFVLQLLVQLSAKCFVIDRLRYFLSLRNLTEEHALRLGRQTVLC